MSKFYAVKVGKQTGIFNSWSECEEQVKGVSGAKYKSFKTESEALAYLKDDINNSSKNIQDIIRPYPDSLYIYVDGSYNAKTNDCGYGAYLISHNNEHIIHGRFKMEDNGRNVEGEVKAAKEALKFVSSNTSYKNITIYHDYEGIGKWADHKWRSNKKYTIAYVKFIDKLRKNGLNINFIHVDGHTGVKYNEYVDKIAKIACGNTINSSDEKLIYELKNVLGWSNKIDELDPCTQYNALGEYIN